MLQGLEMNHPDGTPLTPEELDEAVKAQMLEANERREAFEAEMKENAHDECQNCNKDIKDLPFMAVNSMMRYIPRTYCRPCHNLSILGIGPFAHDATVGEGDEAVSFSREPLGKGWMPIVTELNEKLTEMYPDYAIVQVKEKFGTLCYYTDDLPLYTEESQKRAQRVLDGKATDWEAFGLKRDPLEGYTDAHLLIHAATKQCAETCEDCGQPGQLTVTSLERAGYVQTLCEEHMQTEDGLRVLYTDFKAHHEATLRAAVGEEDPED